MNNNHIQSIDILKFFAVILITHSHMEIIYGPYKSVCTGGAIGDALFFFISGFTLFLGRDARFDNWYKRRINRIYPTVFSWAIISCLLFGNQDNFVQTLLRGGGGFVSCILVCYIPLYFIKRYLVNYIRYVTLITILTIIIVYFFLCNDKAHMYASNNIMWPVWCFSMMLIGAITGLRKRDTIVDCENVVFSKEIIKMMVCLFSYYLILYVSLKMNYDSFSLLGLAPLYGVVYFLYRISCSSSLLNIYNKDIVHKVVYFCGALCLEVYLVQSPLYTDKWNIYFPLNVLFYWILIFLFAFVVKIISNIISQTFKSEEYNWSDIFKL